MDSRGVGIGSTTAVGGPIELGGATPGTPREDLKSTQTRSRAIHLGAPPSDPPITRRPTHAGSTPRPTLATVPAHSCPHGPLRPEPHDVAP